MEEPNVRYRNEVPDPTVILYAAAVGPDFVLMDDNGCPIQLFVTVDDNLQRKGIGGMDPYNTQV